MKVFSQAKVGGQRPTCRRCGMYSNKLRDRICGDCTAVLSDEERVIWRGVDRRQRVEA